MKVGIISPFPMIRAALAAFLVQSGSFSVESDIPNVEDLRRSSQACPTIWVLHVPDARELSQTVRALHTFCPEVPILALRDKSEFEIEAIKAGARGLISWSCSPKTFLKALRMAAQGEVWLSDRGAKAFIAHHLIPLSTEQLSSRNLTEREAEILAIVASGRQSLEIANHLHISLATVRSHLRTIYRKLGVDNRMAAALVYLHDIQGQMQAKGKTRGDLDRTGDKSKPTGPEMTQKNSNGKNDF